MKTPQILLGIVWDREAKPAAFRRLLVHRFCPNVPKSGSDYTLAATDNGARIVATTSLTITVPTVGTLTNNFECEIVNDSGSTVTIDGPGGTNVTMAADEVAIVMEVNGKQRVAKGASTVIS